MTGQVREWVVREQREKFLQQAKQLQEEAERFGSKTGVGDVDVTQSPIVLVAFLRSVIATPLIVRSVVLLQCLVSDGGMMLDAGGWCWINIGWRFQQSPPDLLEIWLPPSLLLGSAMI